MEEGPVQTDDFGIPGSGELWPDNERTGTPVQDTPATLEAPGGESRPAAPQSSAPAIHQERQPIRPGDISDLDQILRLAASYGASTLYLASNAPPAIRIDGDLRVLFHTPVPAPHEVESLLLRLVLAHNCDVQRLFDRSAWSFDIPEVGRISCVSFHDERGPGAVFRIRRQDSKGAEPFALPSELQSIASTRDGLVLVAGPRGSGKRATMGAVLNAVLRNRRAYAITVERDDLGVDPEPHPSSAAGS